MKIARKETNADTKEIGTETEARGTASKEAETRGADEIKQRPEEQRQKKKKKSKDQRPDNQINKDPEKEKAPQKAATKKEKKAQTRRPDNQLYPGLHMFFLSCCIVYHKPAVLPRASQNSAHLYTYTSSLALGRDWPVHAL